MKLKIVLFGGLFIIFQVSEAWSQPRELYPILFEYARDLYPDYKRIPEDRRYYLEAVAEYIREKKALSSPAALLFIGTNQSTRSIMAQVWARAAAHYYGFDDAEYFSGGINEGPISVNTIKSLERAGFIIYKIKEGGKIYYQVKYSYNLKPLLIYPKKVDDRPNPISNFMAVMVCPNAAQNMPFVKGTRSRIEIFYNDPLGFDGSEEEVQRYDEVNRQIALEMFYLFSKLKHV